jgi:cytochrome c553
MKTWVGALRTSTKLCRKMSISYGERAGNALCLAAAVFFFAGSAWGAKSQTPKPPPSAPTSAAACVGCHGEAGVSANSLWPNLAGQKRDYLAKQLKAFRDQDRLDPMMNAIVQSLSDSDIEALAAYYSSLKP